jgi:hypothetical protein
MASSPDAVYPSDDLREILRVAPGDRPVLRRVAEVDLSGMERAPKRDHRVEA